MNIYNYPTKIYSGKDSLNAFVEAISSKSHKKILIVTDTNLIKIGLTKNLTDLLDKNHILYTYFSETHPNPIEADVEQGTKIYKGNNCDAIIAFGGGSPMDTAKVIKIMATHPEPISQYDEAAGGDQLIQNKMPPIYAIPTTAGTGSEVGRSGVIIMRDTGKKTIFFHPRLMPDIAVLDPTLTLDLPKNITAATGLDAFTHNLEAYFCPAFHPIADGIALQGLEMIIDWLPIAYNEGKNLQARENMQIAAAMGATAFQKGLGMIHSLAHPLSTRYGMHHGLTNALLLPFAVEFLENSKLSEEQNNKISRVKDLFNNRNFHEGNLSKGCRHFIETLGIKLGLSHHHVPKNDLESLSVEAFQDPCHLGNMIPVKPEDLLNVYEQAF